ncbi:hypothetical protein [Shewanella sp.]|jgi:hypothetical protein|uniref:hypothetical protein n=1 Tax=Shewanella sp. TaxID=50422 RepID=UPI0040475C9F
MPSLLDDPEAYAFAAQLAEDERKKLGLQSLLGGIGGLLEAPVSYVKERATALATDPIGDMKRTMQGTIDRAKQREQLQQIAYGDPQNPTRVTNQVAADQLAQDYLDMASTMMPVGMISPQAKALQLAQKRGALPVEEGGLGLPLNNTPEMRAKAMGARDWYHGTDRLDRLTEKKSLDPQRATSGPMPYGTDDVALASSYTNKADTSLFDTGDVPNYFQVSNKDLGRGSRGLTNVEDSYYSLPAEKKKELLDNYYKLGYEDIGEATGKYVLHSGNGSIASKSHLDYILKDSSGNPLKALRQLWHDSGELYGKEENLAKIFKVAGYPYEITQTNAPWTSAKGVFAGKAMFKNPLETSNTQDLTGKVIPALKEAFKNDRTRLKDYGADMWDKNTRFTPKQWIAELEKDIAEGKNSYVWTSIPDKVTKQLEKLGYDSIVDVSGKGGGTQSNVLIPFKPNQIRSRFAAFDPFKRDEANILAGALPFGLLAADEETKKDMQSLLGY